jgi:hypothetical protein
MKDEFASIYRKHLFKQIKFAVSEAIGWCIALWIVLGWLVLVPMMFLSGQREKFPSLWVLTLLILAFYLLTWLIIIGFLIVEDLGKKLKKQLQIIKENAEKEIALLKNDQCPECKTNFDSESKFCSNCGKKTPRKIKTVDGNEDSYVWHY